MINRCLTKCFFFLQSDMQQAISRQKPTVNDEDLDKLKKFTDDFGQEGWVHSSWWRKKKLFKCYVTIVCALCDFTTMASFKYWEISYKFGRMLFLANKTLHNRFIRNFYIWSFEMQKWCLVVVCYKRLFLKCHDGNWLNEIFEKLSVNHYCQVISNKFKVINVVTWSNRISD